MNPLRRIHHKAKPAAMFLIVLLVVLGSSIWEKRLMSDMNSSVSSLYQDRLLPAAGLFELNDLMYTKRHVLESYLAQPSAAGQQQTQQELTRRNAEIHSLISRYEATYLVAEENQVLRDFKARLHRYNAVESQLMTAQSPVAPAQTAELRQQFGRIHTDLARLNQIQLQVGQQLSQGSAAIEGNAVLLSNMQIALLVIFMLAIQQALLLDKHPLLPDSLKNFRLN
ncbi:hypothetical protein GCM10027048_23180 [Hymenobacter coalescens]